MVWSAFKWPGLFPLGGPGAQACSCGWRWAGGATSRSQKGSTHALPGMHMQLCLAVPAVGGAGRRGGKGMNSWLTHAHPNPMQPRAHVLWTMGFNCGEASLVSLVLVEFQKRTSDASGP